MKYNIDTLVVHGDETYDGRTGAISYPIYQSATFRHPGLNQSTGYDYSREKNPTRDKLESTIALLEGGAEGFAFSTGMAAITNLLELFSCNDHIIVSDDLYGGTYRLFEEIYKKHGLEFSYTDTSDVQNIQRLIKDNTRAVFLETPSNPMMKISDIELISALAGSYGLLTIVDNTFLTPYYQKPLSLGADIVVHSATKFLGGHNDTLAGLVVVKNNEWLIERLRMIQKTTGAVLSPFDSWLILRGIKTLGIRMDRQQDNAGKITEWLKNNRHIDKVYYPGMSDHVGYETAKRQGTGFGAMASFTVKDPSIVEEILKKTRLIAFAESLGGVETLITYPLLQTHAAIPEEMLKRLGVNNRLLRLSVGIECAEDIIKDLDAAMG